VWARTREIWFAIAAIVVVVALQSLTINDLSFGRRRLGPTVEAIVIVLLAGSGLLRLRAMRRLQGEERRQAMASQRNVTRRLVVVLTAVVSIVNAVSLYELSQQLVFGHMEHGLTILVDALNIWSTNVIAFSLWYSMLDHGGPLAINKPEGGRSEFIFPHMTLADSPDALRVPGFVDYLFLSFTTSTAFSPTDTLPLTERMKLLMMLQAMISLLTLVLVAARAVNLIGG